MEVDLNLSQILNLADNFDAKADRVGDEILAAVTAAAAVAERTAKALAPVRTGALRNSIDTKVYGSGRLAGVRAVVRANTHYSWYVEAGTARQKPQPFMEPARAAAERQLMKAMTQIADLT